MNISRASKCFAQIIFLSFCFVVDFCLGAFIFLCFSCLLSLIACCSKLGVLCCFFTLLFLLVVSHTCCYTMLLALSFHLLPCHLVLH